MSFNNKPIGHAHTEKAYALQKDIGNQLTQQMLDFDTSKSNSISKKKTAKKTIEINPSPLETDMKIEDNIVFYENFLNTINDKNDNKKDRHHHHHNTPNTPKLLKRVSKDLINFPNNPSNITNNLHSTITKKIKPRSSLNVKKNSSSFQLFNGNVSKTISKFQPIDNKGITIYQTKSGELTEESKFMQSKNSNNHIVDIKSFDNNNINNNHHQSPNLNNLRANSNKDLKEFNNSLIQAASNVIKTKSPKRSDNSASNHLSNKDILGKNKQDNPDMENNVVRLSAINEISKDGNAIGVETRENKENKKNTNAPLMSLSDSLSNQEKKQKGRSSSSNNMDGGYKAKNANSNQYKKKKRSWFLCCLPVH